jgi:proline iminopeptidase
MTTPYDDDVGKVILNDTTIWFDQTGPPDAPVLLTMHGGLGFDHLYMERSFHRLSDRFRVVAYDHRGNGQSVPAQRESITMEQLADDAAALLDHLDVDRAIVLGHSYGGFIAQEFALRHGDRLTGLVLVDTTPGQLGTGEVEDSIEPGPPIPDELLALFATLPATDEEFAAGVPATLPYYFHDRGNPTVLEAAHAMTDGTRFRVEPMVRGFEVLAGWSSVNRLDTITAPTLVIVGRHDLHTSWPQSTSRIGPRIPGAEVVVFENSAHFPWVEESEAFFAVLEEWLAKVA